MEQQKPPLGQRFSHVYLRVDKLLPDSKRARIRIGTIAESRTGISDRDMSKLLLEEFGIYGGYDIRKLLAECELRDFLDFVTVVWRHLMKIRHVPSAVVWIEEVRRVFREESLGYAVDDGGGVHFSVDAEYERNRTAVIAGLGSVRYGAVLHAFEAAQSSLDGTPQDYKAAVRLAFDSVETLFKLMFVKAPKLATSEIRKYLIPHAEASCKDDIAAKRAASKIVESFIDWVDSVHFYRHGQASEEPTQPPAELAILMLSQAASYLRWLTTLDIASVTAAKKKD